MTTLSDYIKQVGPKTFAKKFGITERAALSYQYKTRTPRAKLAQRIVEKSPVSWEGIYSTSNDSRSAA